MGTREEAKEAFITAKWITGQRRGESKSKLEKASRGESTRKG